MVSKTSRIHPVCSEEKLVRKTSRIHPVYVYLNMIYTPTNTNAIRSPSPLKLYIFLLFIGNIHTQAY